MLPLPPRSTLFPSTTPFRPHVDEPQRRDAGDAQDAGGGRQHGHVELVRPVASRQPGVMPGTMAAEPGDRKSTRLNSSHAKISYAVFRLKKNKLLLEIKIKHH